MALTILLKYYEVLGNADQTEGRGGLELKCMFQNEDDAVAWARSKEGQSRCGVMGRGSGQVVQVTLYTDTGYSTSRIERSEEKIWGYDARTSRYNYLDGRSPADDPEWAEYQRLQAKFQDMP